MTKKTRLIIQCSLLLALAGFIMLFNFAGRQMIEQERVYVEARTEYSGLRELAQGGDICETESIDWDALRAINPDVVGWLYVPDTGISYPVVQGEDNAHYLRHTFSGERNASGTIFLDFRDSTDFHSAARVFGHNMRDGSMFAELLSWTGDMFIIHTPGDTLGIMVTARGAVSVRDEIFTAQALADEIVLVTCVNGRPDLRWVVRGEPIRHSYLSRRYENE